MKSRHPLLVAALALAATGGGLVATSAPASAAPTTCQGKAVTIVATKTVTQGTEGDDVVAMEPDSWNTFTALGGNDTICLAAGAGESGGRDPRPPYGFLDAGAGDDTVVNLMTPATSLRYTTAVLGTGSDTFQGADVGEVVFAEKEVRDFDDPHVVDPELVGAQTDVVTGADTVHTSAPNDGPNLDRITFGTGGGGTGMVSAVVDGPLAPEGLLDFTAARSAALKVRAPSRMRPVPYGFVTVDNRTRTIEASGVALQWTGDVEAFTFGIHGSTVDAAAVSFQGSDADERVTFADVQIANVDMGAGADTMAVDSYNTSFLPLSAEGGSGRDSASIDVVCREGLEVRLDRSATCDRQSGPFTGFRDVFVYSGVPGSTTTLVGTDRSERLGVSGYDVRIRGRAGADEILVDDSYRARVSAGAGRDRTYASGDDVVVRGQGGRDTIRLGGTAGIKPTGRRTWQQLALGGPGDDVLHGTTDDRPDRLLGGAGRDRADGHRGRRDYCTAEVIRRCERP